MEERVFVDRNRLPEAATLKEALGKAYPLFEDIVSFASGCSSEWKYYNRRYGWTLRFQWRKKPFFWITPLKGNFHLGFSLKKEEKDLFLTLDVSEKTRRLISDAKQFPEGYAVQFVIADAKILAEVRSLVERLLELRG